MGKKLGINGFGRIGKLTLWHQIARKFFDEIVINIGRTPGNSIEDIAHYAERDSTYGSLSGFLYGLNNSKPIITELNEEKGTMIIDGIKVTFLRTQRNPVDISWKENDIELVVDTTGQFLDPTAPSDSPKGSVRGHIDAGAKKVIVSAPFKIKDKSKSMPEDAVTTVMGINGDDYDHSKHTIISNASCTTTCLAHMIKPLLDTFGVKNILSASMATIHASTGSQQVLDRLPGTGASDLRKNRSIFNNIILTTTGAAKALMLVIPEMAKIGFIAESIRTPTTTGSLIVLNINIKGDLNDKAITKDIINGIYEKSAANDPNKYLLYTSKQNVSCDIIGMPKAAAIIEGHETDARTANIDLDLANIPGIDVSSIQNKVVNIPVTQATIYGWYDNEMASYVNMLGDRTVSIAEQLLQ